MGITVIMNIIKNELYTSLDFENYIRNKIFGKYKSKIINFSKIRKTGTTICGCIFKEGVILASDTRSTSGSIVADKNCFKIHKISNNIYCCGAGTAADCDYISRELKQNYEFLFLEMKMKPQLISVITQAKRKLFQYQGYIGAYLIVGGIDIKGPGLFTCYSHGSTDNLPYVTMGSGSLAAISILETGFKIKMDLKTARNLIIKSIKVGIMNDLGSGSRVDICIINNKQSKVIRSIFKVNSTSRNLIKIKCENPIILSEIIWENF